MAALSDTTLNQGEDRLLDVIVLDDDGNSFKLDLATDILASISVNNVIQTKYSLQAKTGYGDLIIKPGAGSEHIAQIKIKREQSQNFPVGKMSIALLVDQPDVDLTEKRDEFSFPAGDVISGVLRGEEI